MTYGDGEGVNAWGSFNRNFSHSYSKIGTYRGRDTARCGCSSTFSFASATATVVTCGQAANYSALQSCGGVIRQNAANIQIDGCSFIPNSLGSFFFNQAPVLIGTNQGGIPPSGTGLQQIPCNQHDFCYGTCGQARSVCDSNLAAGVTSTCNAAFPTQCTLGSSNCIIYFEEAAKCHIKASLIGVGVAFVGGSFYKDAQVEDCECCGG